MYNLNKDDAVISVKNIVDCNRCLICDQLSEPCVRYQCGHLTCQNCAVIEESCYICLSQLDGSTILDEPYSLRVKHASALVTTFEDAFNLDVNRRSRISEQMKVEKELFPKCIQAPIKYSNKQKQINPKKILRSLILPGENINKSSINMDHKIEYVQQWLNSTEQSSRKSLRKPLKDLNINQIGQSNKNYHTIRKNTKPTNFSKKRSKHIKTMKTDTFMENLKKRNRKSLLSENALHLHSKLEDFDKNDSGIIIDDDQNETIDKDKLACMAVIEAELNNNKSHTVTDNLCYKLLRETINTSETNSIARKENISKVPFNKKSPLVETCKLCNSFNLQIKKHTENTRANPNIVNITVDSKSFVATISIFDDNTPCTKELSVKSVSVQTNVTYANEEIQNEEVNKLKELSKKCRTELGPVNTLLENSSQKMGSVLGKINENYETIMRLSNDEDVALPKCTIIEDSDSSNFDTNSDTYINTTNIIEVTADIHESCNFEDYVLKSLHEDELNKRKRKAARGKTPESTNSSEKENFDPNRVKKTKALQKKCNKK